MTASLLGVLSVTPPAATVARAVEAAVTPAPSALETWGLVTATAARRGTTLSGFTRPRAEVPLVAETPGRILEVLHDIGDRVGPERAYARLDDTFIRLELEEVQVQQERLRAQMAYDQREVRRYQELARQSNASASQLDALEQALRDNGHALRGLDVKERSLRERLARTTVSAPEGWQITARLAEPGQWVREGETLGRAGDFSTLLVPFALTPEQFAALEDSVVLTFPDTGTRLPARLYRANPGFDPETRKIALDLALLEPPRPARGGLRVELELHLPERSGAVSLPRRAVEQSYEEHWVTREDGQRLRVLLLGQDREDPQRLRVTAPELRPGDRIRLPGTPATGP